MDAVRALLRRELGTRLTGELQCIEPEPLRLGTLVQAHGAVLADGRRVVLGFVRPGVERAVRDALSDLPDVVAWIDAYGDADASRPLTTALRELAELLPAELDMGRAADVLRELGESVDMPGLLVPRVESSLSTAGLMTRERVQGQSPRALSPIRRLRFDPSGPVRALLTLVLEQAVVRGRVYGDPGPDQVRVTADHRLGLTEVRRVGTLSPGLREPALRLLVALARRDPERVLEWLQSVGWHGPEWDPVLLRDEVTREIRTGPGEDDPGPGALLEEMAAIAGASGLALPPGLVRLGGSLRRATETGRLLDPAFDASQEVLRLSAEMLPGGSKVASSRAPALAAVVGGRIQRRSRSLARRWLERNGPGARDGAPYPDGPPPADLEQCATALVRRIGAAVAEGTHPGALLGEEASRLVDAHRRMGTDVQELIGAHVELARLLRAEAAAAVEGYRPGAGAPEAVEAANRLEEACGHVTLTLTRAVRDWERRYEEENRRIFEGFTQIVRHELGNRLGASESALRLLLSEDPVPAERQARLLELCLEGIRGGLQAVDDIGLMARPLDLEPAEGTIGLQLMVMEAIRAAESEAGARGIRIGLAGPVPDVRVPGGPLRVALANLLGNAVKYHHGTAARERWVRVTAGAARGIAEITVEDNGPGIPKALRDRVFEYRYRGVAEPHGSGLGLAITRVAVERADGRIRLEDGAEGGARFVVRLPAEERPLPEA
ncbi:MAG TPA: AarF/UbiB family protein [Longimicrobiales bacterium]|nr:AarF/UbiB family protein [Longimicrobiales bacterium]